MLVQKTKRSETRGTRQEVEQIGKLVVHELVFGDQTSQTSALVSSGLDMADMFESTSDSHIVRNAIGNVSQGTTVSQIKTQYSELDDLIKDMLKIEQVPATDPSPTGFSVTWGFGNADVQVGTMYSLTPSIVVDRGGFSPSAESPIPNPPPLGTITSARITDRHGPEIIHLTPPPSQGITRTFTLTAPFPTNMTSTLGEFVYNNASVTFDQGPVVQNNYGVNFGGISGQTVNVTGSRVIRFHAPVYRNGNVNSSSSGPSGYSGTDKMFNTTSQVYIIEHEANDAIDVPREPNAFHQWTPLLPHSPWLAFDVNTDWTKEPINIVVGTTTQQYWRVRWNGPEAINRGGADIRLSF